MKSGRLPNQRAVSWLPLLTTAAFLITSGLTLSAAAQTSLPPIGLQFVTHDRLADDADPNPDAQECLAGLRWPAAAFAVQIEAPLEGRGQRLVRFPSPRSSGDAAQDRVAMEWYAAHDGQGSLLDRPAPAVIVVHESGRSMPVGRLIARNLSGYGLHAFMLQLPGYGVRRSDAARSPEWLLTSLHQSIGDARRAHDAVACLPQVLPQQIGIQGTSLGGFVTATVLGLDQAYHRGFILLAGGNLQSVLSEGRKDAAKIRQRLAEAGIDDSRLAAAVRPIEPLRLAHRIRSQSTWLYNGQFDDVVPPASSYALVAAANLPKAHHIELPADHYTGIVFLPLVLQQISEAMHQQP